MRVQIAMALAAALSMLAWPQLSPIHAQAKEGSPDTYVKLTALPVNPAALARGEVSPDQLINAQLAKISDDADVGLRVESQPIAAARAPVERLKVGGTLLLKRRIVVSRQAAVEIPDIPLSRHSGVMVMYDENGQALFMRNRRLPTSLDSQTPQITSQQAVTAAKIDARKRRDAILRQKAEDDEQVSPRVLEAWRTLRLAATPPRLQVWVDDEYQGHLAWNLTVLHKPDPGQRALPFGVEYWIAASGEVRVLQAQSIVMSGHHGTVTGRVWTRSSRQPPQVRPIPNIRVIRNLADPDADFATTDEEGKFSFESGAGATRLRGRLKGPNSWIHGPAPFFAPESEGDENDDIAIEFHAADTERHKIAQISAFYWINFGNKMVADHLGQSIHPVLKTHVNLTGACNAYFYGNGLNSRVEFYVRTATCPNTAYSDVVLHEFGHGIDYAFGGIENGGLSEGIGDAIAILGTRQPVALRDWGNRDASNTSIKYPPTGGVHHQGRVFAGFTWELIQALDDGDRTEDEVYSIAQKIILGGIAREPNTFDGASRECFLVFDADQDLSTTADNPYYSALWTAAKKKNFPIADELPDPSDGGIHGALSPRPFGLPASQGAP